MKLLPTTFKYDATFHLKSGEKLVVRCDDIKITYNGSELTSYNMLGVGTGDALYIRLDDISAITYKKRSWLW